MIVVPRFYTFLTLLFLPFRYLRLAPYLSLLYLSVTRNERVKTESNILIHLSYSHSPLFSDDFFTVIFNVTHRPRMSFETLIPTVKLRCLVVSAVSLFLFDFLYFAPFGSPHSDTRVLASFRSSFFCDANGLISSGCEGNCMELFGNNKTTLQLYNSEHRNGLSFSIISSFRSHYVSYFVVWRVPGLTGRRTKCRYGSNKHG